MSEAKRVEQIDASGPTAGTGSARQPQGDRAAADDGWSPVGEQNAGWTPDSPGDPIESMMGEDDAVATTEILASGTFDSPVHHNPMPDDGGSPAESSASPAAAETVSPSVLRARPAASIQDSYNSNEAILGSTIVSGVRGASTRLSARSHLPSRADAPPHPVDDLNEPRALAWVIPGILFVGGVGAGAYVCAGTSPILGGIAIALSMVGSLFLRVLLKQ